MKYNCFNYTWNIISFIRLPRLVSQYLIQSHQFSWMALYFSNGITNFGLQMLNVGFSGQHLLNTLPANCEINRRLLFLLWRQTTSNLVFTNVKKSNCRFFFKFTEDCRSSQSIYLSVLHCFPVCILEYEVAVV